MGAGESRPEQDIPQQPQQQQQEPSPEPKVPPKAEPEAEAKPPLPKQEHGEPQVVANEYPKLVKRRSKAGNLMTAIEDIQRVPMEAIYQEFDRLLIHAQAQIQEVHEMPCLSMANRLKDCLKRNHERSCRCFPAMEEYQQCILRATQDRVDDMAAREPVPIPVEPEKPKPCPPKPAPCPAKRSWWRFWTWFK